MSRASDYLLSQYQQRKNRNPRYSIRAFARTLEINPGRVSQYFDNERPITKAAGANISAKLDLDETQRTYFLHLIELDTKERRGEYVRRIKEDELSMIVEWYHDAILTLVNTADFKFDFDWMAQRMGLPVTLIQSSWERLERLGYVKVEGNKVITDASPLLTTSDIPSHYLRLSHKDSLKNIIDNIDQVSVEKRDVSSITLAVDPKKLPKAKEMIRTFRRRLANYLSQGKKSSVYTINVQLFPLSKD
ncbi:DUF4423 domain-containing protein [Bdellovibrio sp. HCB2-146]|uniref:DUF4423 domain-containing protein n=1 Tax=Bdellovibrio sp. HCB2-146 TaxID=3394362 RepID=UPI0039BD8CAD